MKLRALVRDHWGLDALAELGGFPGGAAGHGDRAAWVLAEQHAERSLGPALAWARQAGATQLHLLVDASGGLLARRAAAFTVTPRVWWVRGRVLEPAQPEPITPIDRPAIEGPAADLAELKDLAGRLTSAVRAMGADLVVRADDSLRIEVLGLEVARVVRGAATGDGPALRLEIGVGHHDREAHRMVQGDLDAHQLGDLDGPVAAALDEVVSQVARHRRPGVASHPANQLAPERWLRAVLVAKPDLFGLAKLAPVELSMLPSALGEVTPAAALGTDGDGQPVLVVCSTGVDPDLVPTAADARLALSVGSQSVGSEPPRLVLAMPEQDDHPLTRALAATLAEPAEVRPVKSSWRE